MKTRLYVIAIIAAFVLILSNAFYGHELFSANHPEDISKYSIYVHLQPEWSSHPSNLLFEVTNVWNNKNASETIYYDELSEIPALDEHNYNQLQYIGKKSFVELKHRFSDCHSNWQPILYRYAIDSLQNQFAIMGGAAIDEHPYAIMYTNVSLISGLYDYATGYVQFIPICTSEETTSYKYSVKINDADVAFDVFFVNDTISYTKFIENPDTIDHFYTQGCFGLSRTSFSGQCQDISKDAGLLIWIPDDLNLSLTKIIVNLREV